MLAEEGCRIIESFREIVMTGGPLYCDILWVGIPKCKSLHSGLTWERGPFCLSHKAPPRSSFRALQVVARVSWSVTGIWQRSQYAKSNHPNITEQQDPLHSLESCGAPKRNYHDTCPRAVVLAPQEILRRDAPSFETSAELSQDSAC